MREDYIKVVLKDDFDQEPIGVAAGIIFREDYLVPLLRAEHKVGVDLTGYNRYGITFLKSAFQDLIYQEGFKSSYLNDHLRVIHKELKSFEVTIKRLLQC